MDVRRADLHTHTHYSDGKLAPSALVQKLRHHGLQAVAITDHDSIAGLAEAMAAGLRCHVEVIPGVELSVTVDDVEVHLLGYFFDPEDLGLNDLLVQMKEQRVERAQQIVERLNALGLSLTFEAVRDKAGGGVIGRPHVAAALVAAGHVDTYAEAFARYLRDDGPAFVPKPHQPAEEALAVLHAAGGIGVLAHPGHWTRNATLRALVYAGLDGIETVHPAHDAALVRYYRRAARDLGLVETGGSDFHGYREQDEENLGRYSIPFPQLERLRAACTARVG